MCLSDRNLLAQIGFIYLKQNLLENCSTASIYSAIETKSRLITFVDHMVSEDYPRMTLQDGVPTATSVSTAVVAGALPMWCVCIHDF